MKRFFFVSGYLQEFSCTENSSASPPRAEEIVTQHDGGIPIFRTRSAEETEAAHDLLSLSQSLPPLPAPGAVTIHHHIPNGDDDPPSASYTYRPLSPEPPPPSYRTTSPIPVSIPCYQPPIVYVVQVPAVPTPPTSECSSDAENQQICLTETITETTTIPIEPLSGSNEDIIILPLSPEPETNNRTKELETTSSVIVSSVQAQYEQQQTHPPIREQSVITSNHLTIPDRRRNKTRTNNIKTNKDNSNNNNDNINNNNNEKTVNNNVSTKRHYTRKSKTVSYSFVIFLK